MRPVVAAIYLAFAEDGRKVQVTCWLSMCSTMTKVLGCKKQHAQNRNAHGRIRLFQDSSIVSKLVFANARNRPYLNSQIKDTVFPLPSDEIKR